MTSVILLAQLSGGGGGGAGTVTVINGISPDGTGLVTLTKADLGLGNVNNTADSAKSFTASQVSDSSTIGRTVLTAADAAAVRTAIGAGTSSVAIGTTSSTAKAGDYQPAAANISDSTSIGRSVLTAADAAAVRSAIGAGTSSVAIGTTSGTAADAAVVNAYVATKADDSAAVHKTGAETVAGVKTFSSEPVVPTPTSGTSAANKSYVDSAITSVGGVYTVMYSGGTYPTQPASAPGGVQVRQFYGPIQYSGPTWAGVLDLYTYAELT
ncbi:hypothetical protein [Leifsonia sp. Root227]|uniref:hypothetical protein n=1 Tax=Leifsonia sp. Root227 TaxID=1736496 RepID=UPI000B24BEC7|nr:hypothetical protein [Leifsonia sp. Root227]